MMWGYPWGWGMMLWGSLWSIFWLVIVVLAIWALVRWLGGQRQPERGPVGGASAMEILRQRYARGEIDAATFEQMRERLEGTHGPNEPIPT